MKVVYFYGFSSNLSLCFSESEEGDVWYYSTQVQLNGLLDALDENDMESVLCREISDCRDEINRQMEITEKVTAQQKGNKKTYIDAENGECCLVKYFNWN